MSDSGERGDRFALVGADTLLIECGDLLREKGQEIAVVAAGSARVKAWAESAGLPVVDAEGPVSEWGPELASHPVDWLFAITHLAILPDDVVASASKGAINFHDGPLPSYGGLNTPAWALHDGVETYGISWHVIASGVDTGDLVKTRTFDLEPGETSLSLNTRNFAAAIETFAELVDDIVAGSLVRTPQDTTVERRTFSRHDRFPSLVVLDWSQPASVVDRTVRALTFGPYPNPLGVAKALVGDRVVLVTGTELVDTPSDTSAQPGEIVELVHDRLVVATGEGQISITSISDQTGSSISLDELGLAVGDRLDSATSERDELTRIGSLLARAEKHHLEQLTSLDPVEVPWASTPSGDHRPTFESVPLAVPSSIADRPASVAAGLAVLLARLSGKDRFHVSMHHPAVAGDLSAAARFLAPTVPVEIEVSAGALGDVVEQVALRFDEASDRAPMLWELIARDPELSAVPELVAGRSLPVAVRLAGDSGPATGTVVELVADGSSWALRYDAGLVDQDDATLLTSCLANVLRQLDAAPDTPVPSVDLLGVHLRTEILHEWNATDADLPPDALIHRLFEAQVDSTPDATAVVFEDRSLTYAQLDEKANRLAHHLIDLGVGHDQLVGVHVPRGLDLVVSVLAVLKAGGAYVPLDPLYPQDRLAHMITDSGCLVVITESTVAASLPGDGSSELHVVVVDTDSPVIGQHPATRPESRVPTDGLAYCIYTSGSTGLPKGVLVEHRNAVNFFVGMDDRVPHEHPATWFAVTSLSFDISVLELLYTLTRGFSVVVYLDRDRAAEDSAAGEVAAFTEQHAENPIGFSLFYFSGDEAESEGRDKYRLLLEGAKFADAHGFEAVWTPERHFHAFGGLYPQPAVTGAAVAAITQNVDVRAGSVVMPLHHPIRVAEAWSIVDNLSGGRVGISVASGWQPNDFVLMPENYARAKDAMFEGIEQVKRLWRGETVPFPGATDADVEVRTLPRPVQPELPVWITSAGNPETYKAAGSIGANVLTHLLGQSIEQLAPKLDAYRNARAEAGFDPDGGKVTLMLHTFVGDQDDDVRELVREPLKQYLGTSFSLLKEYAWSFPAFQRPGHEVDSNELGDDDFQNLSEDDLDAVLEFAFLRYYESSGLFGTPENCVEIVDRLKGIGVTEIACLIDFGVPTDIVLESLPSLDRLRQRVNRSAGEERATPETGSGSLADQSVAAQVERHGVTHLQCTPSMARMFLLQDDTRAALAKVDHVFIGGEAFPTALARDLVSTSATGNVTNMYGPTETTIWSTTWPLAGDLDQIPIGTPIANTRVYVLDRNLEPVPPGVAGDLWIGGAGVVRGYHARPELTAERFVPDPFRGDGHRMYQTGDQARWRREDGGSGALLEFLGRADHQVKIRGYRIELGEIEAQLGRFPGVGECVAVVREDTPGDQQLVGYVSSADGSDVEPSAVKDHLRITLPEVMVPGHICVLDDLPHTPNGKIDRNALPTLAEVLGTRTRTAAPVEAGNDLERQVLAVWEETLGTEGIGVNDNFFDIGGHSLLAVRMHRRLRDALDRAFPLTDVYRYPTVRSFAEALSTDTTAALLDSSKDRAARRRESLGRRRARR